MNSLPNPCLIATVSLTGTRAYELWSSMKRTVALRSSLFRLTCSLLRDDSGLKLSFCPQPSQSRLSIFAPSDTCSSSTTLLMRETALDRRASISGPFGTAVTNFLCADFVSQSVRTSSAKSLTVYTRSFSLPKGVECVLTRWATPSQQFKSRRNYTIAKLMVASMLCMSGWEMPSLESMRRGPSAK